MNTKQKREYLEPAASIVEKLGGAHFVADVVLEVSRSIVFRFMYPKDVGGRDGWIPREYHDTMLAYSDEHDLGVKRSDFYEVVEDLKRAS